MPLRAEKIMEVKDKLKDTKDRNLARFVFDKNIVVQAGAGTGKTTLLIDRLCYLILGHKADDESFTVENIVALTFTEKAAGEIKMRLAGRLNNVITALVTNEETDKHTSLFIENLKSEFNQNPEAIIKNAKKTLSLLDRSQIGTIHSFASYVLKTFALQAQVDPYFEVDEGANFYKIFKKEFTGWLNGELSERSINKDKWKYVLKRIELSDISIFAQQLCSSKLEHYRHKDLKLLIPLCKEKLASLAELKEKYAGSRSQKAKSAMDEAQEALENLITAIEKNNFDDAKKIKISFPNSKLANWSEYDFETAKSLVKFVNSANVLNQNIVSLCLELLMPFVNAFRNTYRQEGFVSFDGLLVKTRNLLSENISVRNNLKKHFRYLLIDEFQDTDPLQGEIILFLAEAENSRCKNWQDIKLQQGKLFIVGDPKQSIYRFRGADIRAYDKFVNLMANQNALKCFLQTNFRGQQSLVETVNSVISQVMKKDETQCEYVDIYADRKNLSKDNFEIALADSGEKLKADDFRRLQADFIAEWICENLGKLVVGGGEKLKLKDIAVLFRNTTNLNIYLEALRQKNISYIVEENKYFYSAQEIIDIVNLLKVIINPDDKISLIGVLRSPLAGLTDAEIYRLKQNSLLDYRKKVPNVFKNAGELYLKLQRFNILFGRVSTQQFIDTVVKETYCFELFANAYNKEQTISNIFKFISVVNRLGEITYEMLEDFLDPSKDFAQKNKEGESPLADKFLDALNITTIHKSKGLEFPVVIVADINAESRSVGIKSEFLRDWYSNSCGFSVRNFKDVMMADLQEREKLHSRSEEIRNLYVALTRAKDKLLLVGNNQKPVSETTAYLLDKSIMFPDVEADNTYVELEGLDFPIKFTYFKNGSFKKGKHAGQKITVENPEKWSVNWRKRTEEFEYASRGQTFTSATVLKEKSAGKIPASGEKAQYGKLLGNVCHKMLEIHDFKGKINFGEIEKVCVLLSENLKGKDEIKKVSETAFKILSDFSLSSEYKDIASSKIIARELPFCYIEKFREGEVTVNGFIDLVTVKGGEINIIDYKSERVLPGKETAHAFGFKQQCEIYKTAITKLFPSKKISAKILFLRSSKSVEM